MAKTGRPRKKIDRAEFEKLAAIGCGASEICWWFRDDETGKPISLDTLTRWCKHTYGCTFADYIKNSGGMQLKITLRRNQIKLSETSAAMAIWLGKQYLGQREPDAAPVENDDKLDKLLGQIANYAADK